MKTNVKQSSVRQKRYPALNSIVFWTWYIVHNPNQM